MIGAVFDMAMSVSSAPQPLRLQWYWLSKTWEYVQYDKPTSDKIEAEFAAKRPSAMVSVQGSPYQIDFDKMEQRNLKGKLLRPVRRVKEISVDKSHVWNYLNDPGNFVPYSDKDSRALEKAYLSHCPSWSIVTGRGAYEIDLAKMTQKNINTGFVRRIVRMSSAVPSAPAQQQGWPQFQPGPAPNPLPYPQLRPLPRPFIPHSLPFHYQPYTGPPYQYPVPAQAQAKPHIPSSSTPATGGEAVCKICYTNKQDVVFLPCGHLGCCRTCASKVNGKCPFCNTVYTAIKDVYQP